MRRCIRCLLIEGEAKRLKRKQDNALKTNSDTIEMEAVDFVRQIAEYNERKYNKKTKGDLK